MFPVPGLMIGPMPMPMPIMVGPCQGPFCGTPPMPHRSPYDSPGKVVNINNKKYQFQRKLGNGAFGVVHSARSLADNQSVAVKVITLKPVKDFVNDQLSKSILSEIGMCKRLAKTSRHIVHMFDFDFDPQLGKAFIVMELGEGDLENLLSSRPRLNPVERKGVWNQLASAALTLHQRGIVHLDIKPQNLLVFPGNLIKVGDLGIATKAYTDRTRPNGTPFYSAPEVVQGPMYGHAAKNTSTCDSWSWGAVLYRIAYGVPPTYEMPCDHPPAGVPLSRDPRVLNILRHTLVYDFNSRVDPSWFAAHPM